MPQGMVAERWKTIPFAPSYEASDLGRIRRTAGGQGARPMLRKQDLEHTGYLRVRLSEGGKRMRVSVHRTVLLTFAGEPPTPKHQAAHADNDKTNNRLTNLRWATCRENILDKQIHGTQAKGETQGKSKLTAPDVLAIRSHPQHYHCTRDLARRYGVCTQTIRRVRAGESWTHV